MWYEALPAGMLVVLTSTALPYLIATYLHPFSFGHPYRRKMRDIHQRIYYTRDECLTGAAWITAGLENIPDE